MGFRVQEKNPFALSLKHSSFDLQWTSFPMLPRKFFFFLFFINFGFFFTSLLRISSTNIGLSYLCFGTYIFIFFPHSSHKFEFFFRQSWLNQIIKKINSICISSFKNDTIEFSLAFISIFCRNNRSKLETCVIWCLVAYIAVN